MAECKLHGDDTLPDDAWKDSFDKLLEQKEVLREKNLLKKDVRVSFNMNSSYENSCVEDPEHIFNSRATLQLPASNIHENLSYKNVENYKAISTPQSKTCYLFKCTLSPIGNWRSRHRTTEIENHQQVLNEVPEFNATAVPNDANNFNIPNVRRSPTVECNSRKELTLLSLVVESIKTKRIAKNVCFDSHVVSQESKQRHEKSSHDPIHAIPLLPGKWRKSLNILRRAQSTGSRDNPKGTYSGVSDKILPQKVSLPKTTGGQRKSTLNRKFSNFKKENFKHQLLLRCQENRIIPFDAVYNEEYLYNCRKIGEGAFGEVFLYSKPRGKDIEKTILKIIPIEGKELINGEVQKSYEEIYQEVVISLELCSLKNSNGNSNSAAGFVNVNKVRCVKGQYPKYLQNLWEEYDAKRESENDHPECFNSSQQFLILEMAYGGEDMEKFIFRNAEQSFYALQQIIYTLAVGEDMYQFEHRDLHWGNILILKTNEKFATYRLKGNVIKLPTKGVRITIIDYTLSRITYNDCCYYNDLSNDPELFSATGDYQFDIYRMMRDVLNDKWEIYNPKTNVFWISYIISKMLEGVTYKSTQSKLHSEYMEKLISLNTNILKYASCFDCAIDLSSRQKNFLYSLYLFFICLTT
ncbi:haspin isoform X2 [Haematobia irritans]|uniref:haspin isoform X2 n=1 Tax=Haematobia irritans TaxID=7368 RepID=UPI003F4FE7AA